MNRIKKIKIVKYNNDLVERTYDSIVVEKVQNIFVNREFYASLICTPSEIKELAAGFLFFEGVISSKDCISAMEELNDNILCVMLKNEFNQDINKIKALTSGCAGGSIGLDFLEESNIKPVKGNCKISSDYVFELMKEFNSRSELFKQTGGVHSCAICDDNGILYFSEDIGRHNAIDKIIGKALFENIKLENKIILTTGRISSEIAIKAAKAGVPILISHSAPTSLALDIAKAAGMTVLGFARGRRMNIYCGEERISF